MSTDRAKGGRKPGTTLAEVEQRKQLVFEMMIQGMRPVDIHALTVANSEAKGNTDAGVRARYRRELDWGVGYDSICNYYSEALARLKEEHVIERTAAFRQSVLRYDDLYRRCIQAKDMRGARQVLNDRNKLLALNDFDHGGSAPIPGSGTPDDRTIIELPGGLSVEL